MTLLPPNSIRSSRPGRRGRKKNKLPKIANFPKVRPTKSQHRFIASRPSERFQRFFSPQDLGPKQNRATTLDPRFLPRMAFKGQARRKADGQSKKRARFKIHVVVLLQMTLSPSLVVLSLPGLLFALHDISKTAFGLFKALFSSTRPYSRSTVSSVFGKEEQCRSESVIRLLWGERYRKKSLWDASYQICEGQSKTVPCLCAYINLVMSQREQRIKVQSFVRAKRHHGSRRETYSWGIFFFVLFRWVCFLPIAS